MLREIRAEMDTRARATLSRPFPLRYASGASASEDHPAFARAASAIRRWQGRRVIVQDDVNVFGLFGPLAGSPLEPLLLPRGEGGQRSFDALRGNKRAKLDLEAALVLPDGRLLAFGSGSLPARERLVVVEPGRAPVVRAASDFYRGLRRRVEFAGSELNLEGAIVRRGNVELFQRGNGAASGELAPTNAVGRLRLDEFLGWLDRGASAPALREVLRVDLGRVGAVPLGFTDAALASDGTIVFLACAEASPDALGDGDVLAVRLGLLSDDGARLIDIVDELGAACRIKLEGIEAQPPDPEAQPDDIERFDVVADVDDPSAAALGATLELSRR